MKPHRIANVWLASFLLATTPFTSTTVHASGSLCSRGQHTFNEGQYGLNELSVMVTLPTPGYKVFLEIGPEKITPPIVYLRCEKPKSRVAQVLTEYSPSLRTHFRKLTLKDIDGSQDIEVKSTTSASSSGATATNKCRANSECAKQEFCDTTPRCPGSDISGTCIKKPDFCPMNFDPVTGCDGKVYTNRCAAAAEGQPITGAAKIK